MQPSPATTLPQVALATVNKHGVRPLKSGNAILLDCTLQPDGTQVTLRLFMPYVGKGQGLTILPRDDDEVLALFPDANPNTGVALWGFYNGVDQIPGAAPDLILLEGRSGDNIKSHIRGYVESVIDEYLDTIVQKHENRFVAKDRTTEIAQNDQLLVRQNLDTSVGENETRQVAINRTTTIGVDDLKNVLGNDTRSILGNDTKTVGANSSEIIFGNKTVLVLGNHISTALGFTVSVAIGTQESTITGKETRRSLTEYQIEAPIIRLIATERLILETPDVPGEPPGTVEINPPPDPV